MEHLQKIISHDEWLQCKEQICLAHVPVKVRNTKVQYLADYLGSLPWDYFITGSTGYELTQKSARRLAQRYYNLLPPGSIFFPVSEKFERKDGFHIHGLLQLGESSLKHSPRSIRTLGQLWQLATGNRCIENYIDEDGEHIKWEIWNQIDNSPYMKGLGAAGYCAKYITKRHGDYDLITQATSEDEINYNFMRYPGIKRGEDFKYRVKVRRNLL